MKPQQDKSAQDKAKRNSPKHKRKKLTKLPRYRRPQKSGKLHLWEIESEWLASLQSTLGPALGYSSEMLNQMHQTHLLEALTHRTFAHERHNQREQIKDNQRLEFLGDAILGYISTTHIFERFPELSEGELSTLRASLINRSTLRDIAIRAKLEPYLRLGRGEVKMGEAARDARLADLCEAMIAALYLDLGIKATTDWIWPYLEAFIGSPNSSSKIESRDPKTDLQHWSHQKYKLTPYYTTQTVEPNKLESNQVEERYYQASVFIGESCVGSGEGRTKREAQRKAAQRAIDKLDFMGNSEL